VRRKPGCTSANVIVLADSELTIGAGRALAHKGLIALQPCKKSTPSKSAPRGRKNALIAFLVLVYMYQSYLLLLHSAVHRRLVGSTTNVLLCRASIVFAAGSAPAAQSGVLYFSLPLREVSFRGPSKTGLHASYQDDEGGLPSAPEPIEAHPRCDGKSGVACIASALYAELHLDIKCYGAFRNNVPTSRRILNFKMVCANHT
jgi:hypothetical protein